LLAYSLYLQIVDGLIASHALSQAVEIADRHMPAGAADWVLRVMAESCDESANSWVYVRRIKGIQFCKKYTWVHLL